MMTKIGIHDDDEVSPGVLQAVHIGGSETEFSRAEFQDDAVRAIEGLQLLCDGLGAIWRGIIYNDEFPVEFPTGEWLLASLYDGG